MRRPGLKRVAPRAACSTLIVLFLAAPMAQAATTHEQPGEQGSDVNGPSQGPSQSAPSDLGKHHDNRNDDSSSGGTSDESEDQTPPLPRSFDRPKRMYALLGPSRGQELEATALAATRIPMAARCSQLTTAS